MGGRLKGSPLWQKHLLLKKSSYWSSAAVKEPMLDATAENQAWITPTSESCCDSDDPCENACKDTSTLKIEDEDPDSEV